MKPLPIIATLLLTASICFGQQTKVTEHYVVASGHELATQAGLDVLASGGNAMDAAVAVSMCLSVAEPHASGLGGKLVMLYFDAETGEVSCVEALCTSPGALDVDRFKSLSRDNRTRGYQSVAVPGMLAGLHAAYEKWGTQDWAGLIEPAIRLAEQGTPVCQKTYEMFAPKSRYLRNDPEAGSVFLIDGQVPIVGSVIKQPELAQTFRLIAKDGPDAFYRGPIAKRIVAAAQSHGSALSLKDLENYQPNFPQPLSIAYADGTVYSSPPPLSGGITLLMAMQALADHDWAGHTPRGPRTIHHVASVLRQVYPQVTDQIADHEDAPQRALALLNKQNTQTIYRNSLGITADGTGDDKATKPVGAVVGVPDDASTTHFVVKDAKGNWASVTLSLSHHFGASVVVPGTGLLLNNSMANFALADDQGVNYVAPNKRPRSTVAPVLMLKDGKPVLALGIPGGQRIPTTSLQLMMDMLIFGLDPATSFDLPRYHLRRSRYASEPDNLIDLEQGLPDELAKSLQTLGWSVTIRDRDGSYFGGGTAAVLLPNGKTVGVADQRRTNFADGE